MTSQKNYTQFDYQLKQSSKHIGLKQENKFLNDVLIHQSIHKTLNDEIIKKKEKEKEKEKKSKKRINNINENQQQQQELKLVFQLPPIKKSEAKIQNQFVSFNQIDQQNKSQIDKQYPFLLQYTEDFIESKTFETHEDDHQSIVSSVNHNNYNNLLESIRFNDISDKKNALIQGMKNNRSQISIIKESIQEDTDKNTQQYLKKIEGFNKLLQIMPQQKVQMEDKKKNMEMGCNENEEKNDQQKKKEINKEKIKKILMKNELQKEESVMEENSNMINILCKQIENGRWKPAVRENSQFCIDVSKMKGYLTFGLGLELFQDVSELDLMNYQWKPLNQTGELIDIARSAHSAFIYQKQIYIFGGEQLFNPSLKQRDCLSDVRVAKVQENQHLIGQQLIWSKINTIGDMIEARRNHASCFFTKYIAVYGGINIKNNYLNDLCLFDCANSQWNKFQLDCKSIQGIGFHQMQGLFYEQRKQIQIGKKLGIVEDIQENKRLKEEGILVFGGKIQNEKLLQGLWMIKVEEVPLKMVKVHTMGRQPVNRYGHQMKVNLTLNLIIIHGGINEAIKTNHFLNDLHILKLNNFHWVQVILHLDTPPSRAFFQMETIKNKIIIFGGINQTGYLNLNIQELDMDQVKVNNFLLEKIKLNFKQQEDKIIKIDKKIFEKKADFKQMIDNQDYNNFITLQPVQFQNDGFEYKSSQLKLPNIENQKLQSRSQRMSMSIQMSSQKEMRRQSSEFKVLESQKILEKYINNNVEQYQKGIKRFSTLGI